MATSSHRNFHVPLPDEIYHALRSEAARQRRAATTLVREAVEDWLERIGTMNDLSAPAPRRLTV
jgi:predicted DNA-binding protein